MATEFITLADKGTYSDSVQRAAQCLRDGGLVAFPTETVYGVGVRADRREAVAQLRQVKERVEGKPFTLHIPRPDALDQYVPEVNSIGRRLIRRCWPGPLTIVCPVAAPAEAPAVKTWGIDTVDLLYHDQTVGVRCPSDTVAAQLLSMAEVPVVAASANKAGHEPPRSADAVAAELSGEVDLILDGGLTRFTKPSTVVRLGERGYEVLREGVIDARTLDRLATLHLLFVCTGNTCRSPMAAAICRSELAKTLGCPIEELSDRGFVVESAGVSAAEGSPASDGAVDAVMRRGIDLSGHRSKNLSVDLVRRADHIFCMTSGHEGTVLALDPTARDRTMLLGDTDDIADPLGGSPSEYESCAAAIAAAWQKKSAEINP